MKNKLVVWGTNAANEKVLIALELQADKSKVLLYTFPEAITTEAFVDEMMNNWRTDKAEVAFPESHTQEERALSVTEGLLPEGLKPEREDLIQRAQTEWHFVVLSTKLHQAYQEELAELKEKVEKLTEFDNGLWESLRTFWSKVQDQARDRNLFREHADSLRDDINALFEDMKKLRSKMQDEFMSSSKNLFDEFNVKLEAVEEKIQAGGNKLNAVFEELKQIQRRYRDSRMSNEHRNKLWERLDGAFKAAKEKKFGPDANKGSLVERHARRLQGLQDAIKRMEDSIRRDEDELKFQKRKIASTEGQLEAQIREAKIKLVEERLASKHVKLEDMNKTRESVERQIAQAQEKEDHRKKMEEAKKQAKEEIAAEVKTSTKTEEKVDEAEAPKEEKTETPKEEESILGALSNVVGESLEDITDTVKAVASVMGEKAAKAIDEALETAEEYVDELTKKEEAATEEAKAEEAAPAAEEVKAEETETVEEKPKKAPAKKKPAAKKEDTPEESSEEDKKED